MNALRSTPPRVYLFGIGTLALLIVAFALHTKAMSKQASKCSASSSLSKPRIAHRSANEEPVAKYEEIRFNSRNSCVGAAHHQAAPLA
jgi:hypothetical protein